jgi:HSP20 family protein
MATAQTNIAPAPVPPQGRQSGELAGFGNFGTSMDRIRDEFDRIFDRMSRQIASFGDSGNGENGWRWGIAVDDQPDNIVVRAEAPGFEANDFDVRVQEGQLVMRAWHETERKGEDGKTEEYREQQCYQSVTLPAGIDKEKVDAKYRNGVLTITIPKTAEGKGKKVAVKAA